jgi:hypothetical protein
MVVWGFEISELLAAALRYRHLRFRPFCIKIIIKCIQKSEITDCNTGGAECGLNKVYLTTLGSAVYKKEDARFI